MLKSIFALAIAMVFTAEIQVAAQDPELSFKGLRLGVSTQDDFKQVFPSGTCNPKYSNCIAHSNETLGSGGYGGASLNYVEASYDANGKLEEILAILDPDSYDGVLMAMGKRYGAPKMAAGKVQNRMGAVFQQKIATWSRKGATLTYTKYTSNLNTSELILISKAREAQDAKESKKAFDDAVKSGL